MDINEVTLLGSIKKISNILTLKNGQHCCWLNILTNVSYQKKDGAAGHIKDDHRVIAYGKYASVVKEKSSIDQKIFIQGRLKTKSWEYNNTFFEKEFIVLERFKLYPHIQNQPKKPEGYDRRQNLAEDEREGELFTDDRDTEMEDLIEQVGEDYIEAVNLQERNREEGWPY